MNESAHNFERQIHHTFEDVVILCRRWYIVCKCMAAIKFIVMQKVEDVPRTEKTRIVSVPACLKCRLRCIRKSDR